MTERDPQELQTHELEDVLKAYGDDVYVNEAVRRLYESDETELERDQLRAELGRRSDEYTHQIIAVAEGDDFQARLKLSYKSMPDPEDMSGVASQAIATFARAFEDEELATVTVVMGKWESSEEDLIVQEERP
jgi:hypothetical protein